MKVVIAYHEENTVPVDITYCTFSIDSLCMSMPPELAASMNRTHVLR